jgi:hypothetical protein
MPCATSGLCKVPTSKDFTRCCLILNFQPSEPWALNKPLFSIIIQSVVFSYSNRTHSKRGKLRQVIKEGFWITNNKDVLMSWKEPWIWNWPILGISHTSGWAPVTHACNSSYSGGRDQEDHGLRTAWAKMWDPISKIPNIKKGLVEWHTGSRVPA